DVIGAPLVQPSAAKLPITSTDVSPLSGYVNSYAQRLSASSHIGGGGSPVVGSPSVGSAPVGSSSVPPVAYAVAAPPPCDGSYGIVDGGVAVSVIALISGGSAQPASRHREAEESK